MRATVRDRATLSQMHPDLIAAYLASRGWVVEDDSAVASVWTLAAQPEEEFEVLLPRSAVAGDFVTRMAGLLAALEAAEDRSQLEILGDIAAIDCDIVRFVIDGAGSADGTIALDTGALLFARAREAVLAAACAAATSQPRAVFPARKPAKATSYLEGVRFGQTERGSFILTVQSPVQDPHGQSREGNTMQSTLADALDPVAGVAAADLEAFTPVPFARRVVATLAEALQVATDTARAVTLGAEMSLFSDVIDRGVSSNLCDALAAILAKVDSDALSVNFSWSPTLVETGREAQRVRVDRSLAGVFEQASKLLKDQAPRSDFELVGNVIRLKRARGVSLGAATVVAVVDDALRSVKVPLGGYDYERVTEAHRDQQSVSLRGELARDGHNWILRDAVLLV